MSDREIHILCHVKGKVQGVGYRAWTQVAATRLGVRGWVMNQPDGSVSACFAGAERDVRALIEQCRKGPPAASVTGVIEQTASAADAGDGHFRIRY